MKVETLAKYKLINRADLSTYDDLDKRRIDLAGATGIAFEDSSAEEEDRMYKQLAQEYKDENSVSNSTEIQISGHDYWHDFEVQKKKLG